MPVILLDDVYDVWLDPGFRKPEAISDLMKRFEVSSRVNPVKNDGEACAEPVTRADEAGV